MPGAGDWSIPHMLAVGTGTAAVSKGAFCWPAWYSSSYLRNRCSFIATACCIFKSSSASMSVRDSDAKVLLVLSTIGWYAPSYPSGIACINEAAPSGVRNAFLHPTAHWSTQVSPPLSLPPPPVPEVLAA